MKANCRLISGASQHVGPRSRPGALVTTIASASHRATCANVGDVVANLGNGTQQQARPMAIGTWKKFDVGRGPGEQ
jgi:hypothetical protein